MHGLQERRHEYQTEKNVQEGRARGNGAHEVGPHGNGACEDEAQYRARKRRVIIEESDNSAALREQQVREGRKPVEKGKYQRLNRIGSSNYNTIEEDGMSINDTEEGVSTPMPTKRQPRVGAMSAKNTDGSTGLTSDLTQ